MHILWGQTCLSFVSDCSFKGNYDSPQFVQWVGLVPISETANNKGKNKLDMHEWMAASLTFVYLYLLPLKILTAKL